MPTTTLVRVSPIHGGLSQPVSRLVAAPDPGWSRLPQVEVNDNDRTSLYRVADGTLSPLTGPMNESDYRSALDQGAIVRGGRRWAWTIPIILPVADEEASKLGPGAEVGLRFENMVFGKLLVQSVFAWNKQEFIRTVYGTDRLDHPGARLWTTDPLTKLLGGEISLAAYTDTRTFAKRILSPIEVRKLLDVKGYEQSVAFQTRNPLHRAHEYALVYGAETILRKSGRRTGVVLNPLVGQLKGDDVPADVRMQTYEALVEGRFLGQGDMDEGLWRSKGQDLNAQLHLIGLDIRMYYGGPREAVMHAIYRQNLGFTHFIIGRKHADAPYDDKSAIWGDFDAQEIFKSLGGELAIQTVNVGFAAYFEEIGRVGLVEDNPGKTQVSISGTKIREILGKGEFPDARVMRPSTARVLAAYYQKIDKEKK